MTTWWIRSSFWAVRITACLSCYLIVNRLQVHKNKVIDMFLIWTYSTSHTMATITPFFADGSQPFSLVKQKAASASGVVFFEALDRTLCPDQKTYLSSLNLDSLLCLLSPSSFPTWLDQINFIFFPTFFFLLNRKQGLFVTVQGQSRKLTI